MADGEAEAGHQVASAWCDDGGAEQDALFVADQFDEPTAPVSDIATSGQSQRRKGNTYFQVTAQAVILVQSCSGDLRVGEGDRQARRIVKRDEITV